MLIESLYLKIPNTDFCLLPSLFFSGKSNLKIPNNNFGLFLIVYFQANPMNITSFRTMIYASSISKGNKY